jgi:hypothetical protein
MSMKQEASRYAPRICRTAQCMMLAILREDASSEDRQLIQELRLLLQDQERWDEWCERITTRMTCCGNAVDAAKAWLWFYRRSVGRVQMVSCSARAADDPTRTAPWSNGRLHLVLCALRRSTLRLCNGKAEPVPVAHALHATCVPCADEQCGEKGDVGRTEYGPSNKPWKGRWGEGDGVKIIPALFSKHASDTPLDMWEELHGLHTRDWCKRQEHQTARLVRLLRDVGGRVIVSLQWLRETLVEDRWTAIETQFGRKRVATVIASAGQQMALLQLGRADGTQNSNTPWVDAAADTIWSGRLSGLQVAVLLGFLPFGFAHKVSQAVTDVQMIGLFGQGCAASASDAVTRWCVERGGLQLGTIRTADVGSGAGTFMAAARLVIGKRMEYVFHVEPLELCRKAHKAAWHGIQQNGTAVGHSFMWGDDPAALEAMIALGHIDLWQYSFRCRPFSHANRQAWWSKERQESARRAIQELADTLEYARRAHPSYVIIENVASVTHLDGGAVWRTILSVLKRAGNYRWFRQDFGAGELPEALSDRDRMWLVGEFKG